ncbi:hypothetical protein AB0I49_12815 [Streptomyces sp. NPDC050617]|uniref:hypothetical protein n=1 Tax=Streptomyces sp. NPDC050617 TaxID=3154628 RepID=UPI003423EEC5
MPDFPVRTRSTVLNGNPLTDLLLMPVSVPLPMSMSMSMSMSIHRLMRIRPAVLGGPLDRTRHRPLRRGVRVILWGGRSRDRGHSRAMTRALPLP